MLCDDGRRLLQALVSKTYSPIFLGSKVISTQFQLLMTFVVSEKVECICSCFSWSKVMCIFYMRKEIDLEQGSFGCYWYFRCWLHWFVDWIFKIIYFNWRLITLQYCGGFCHTLIWISHGCACAPHPEPPSHLPPPPSLWVVPVYRLWVPCFMHQTWTGHLFHIR